MHPRAMEEKERRNITRTFRRTSKHLRVPHISFGVDVDARIQVSMEGEEDIIMPFVYCRGGEYIEQNNTNQDMLGSNQNVGESCHVNKFSITNTCFYKDHHRKCTYRDIGPHGFEAPFPFDKYAEIDFFIC